MSKSLNRVRRALEEAGVEAQVLEMSEGTRTAAAAAEAAECHLDQIAKSIVFRAETTGEAVLFVTAGGNLVNPVKASAVAGEPLGKADAGLIRSQTGFAIGGVSPLGLLSPIRAWHDPRLLEFDLVYAAAGTPRHIFGIDPHVLMELSGAAEAEFTG